MTIRTKEQLKKQAAHLAGEIFDELYSNMKEKNQLQNEFEQKNEAMQKKIHSLIEENSELKRINERDCENHIDLIMKYNTLSEIYKELEERNEALLKEKSELKSINETKLINMLYKNYSDIQEYKLTIKKYKNLTIAQTNEVERLKKLIDTKNNEIHTLENKCKDKDFELYQLRESIPAIKNMSSEQMLEYLRCIESTQS